MKIKFIKKDESVPTPKFETPLAVGLDVTANSIIKCFGTTNEEIEVPELSNGLSLYPCERVLIGTGLYVDLPENIELQVRSRSGLSLKKGLVVANQPGTIDPDYKDEIGVILLNTSEDVVIIEKGERIAQLVPKEILKPEISFDILSEDDIKDRKNESGRKGGFGSTGTK